jgi:hypothetical protein
MIGGRGGGSDERTRNGEWVAEVLVGFTRLIFFLRTWSRLVSRCEVPFTTINELFGNSLSMDGAFAEGSSKGDLMAEMIGRRGVDGGER